MILKDIYNELKRLRIAYETCNREKLDYLKQAYTPIAQAGRIDYSTVKDEEVIFDIDLAKEQSEYLEEQERRLMEGG